MKSIKRYKSIDCNAFFIGYGVGALLNFLCSSGVNSLASIGSEGLMGNNVINIAAGRASAMAIADGALLSSGNLTKTDDMLEKLSGTNADVQIIALTLKEMVIKLNESRGAVVNAQ